MQHLDLTVIRQALAWAQQGQTLWLCTVLSTFGSSPREPGAWLVALRDGRHVGSLSGGCVEEDFLARLAAGAFQSPVQRVRYGDADGDANAGEKEGGLDGPGVSLPCGGILDVLVERLLPYNATLEHLAALEATLTGQRPQLRHVDLASGRMRLENDSGLGERVLLPAGGDEPAPGEVQLRVGPVARLVLAGMSPVAEACAEFAVRLGFEVILCDPRPGMLAGVSLPGVERVEALPSSFIAAGGCHGATAIVALTHDPRIDDLAMIEAVRTEAFYIGVMGSQQTSAARAERLERSGGLSAAELARIQMPVGLRLGSKTPAEIALAVMADIVRVRRGRALADL
ncbi:xanthine dehydrogenase accessory factor [Onishia taeanensis]|uniref:Xanthine dehydrogenase accessory factor n=1 Tax=Onishia taeanensis TaxID=284577 RepID=A0A1G7V7T3_9GAMM|nr:XdhC family protein [Halomonas taeanensis]SDG55571.1 xanthine dehydrogenase accessory factor [Halomonas taeanensis]